MTHIINLLTIIAVTTIFSEHAYGGLMPSRDAKNRTEAICAGKDPTVTPELKQFCSKSGKLAKTLFHCTDTGNAKGVCDSPSLCKNQNIYDACKKFCVDTRRSSKPDAKTLSIQKNLANPNCLKQLHPTAPPAVTPSPVAPSMPTVTIEKTSIALDPVVKDVLPTNMADRDKLLKEFHNKIINKLIALKWNDLNVNQNNFDDLVADFYTPYPFNPYREPGMDKLFPLPTSQEALNEAVRAFKKREAVHKQNIELIDLIQMYLAQSTSPNQEITFQGRDPLMVREALSFPQAFSKEAFAKNITLRNHLINGAHDNYLIKFDAGDKTTLEQFRLYHQNELDNLNQIKNLLRHIPDKKQFFINLTRISFKQAED